MAAGAFSSEAMAAPEPSARRPRVLMVSAFFPAHGGGIEAVAGQLAMRLAASGVHMHWMAGGPADEWPAPPSLDGLQVTPAASSDPLERRIGLPMPLWGWRALRKLWQAVGEADLVHVHDYLYAPTLAAALFAHLRRRPLVVTQHIGEIPFRSSRARWLLERLNRTLGAAVLKGAAQTAFVGQPVLAYFSDRVAFRCPPLLIPNGVDANRYRPAPRCEDAAAVKVLFVGRFVEKKGLPLLRGCLDLPGLHWVFVGWGPLPPVETPHPTVEVTGRLPPEQIVSRYQQADLLVLPSTGEGFPLVVQESLACGTPVLVSREVAEAFPARDPRCVFDVELRTAEPLAALREAIAALAADRTRLAEARSHAVALASQWSWERCVEAYRSVYDRVLDRSAVPRAS